MIKLTNYEYQWKTAEDAYENRKKKMHFKHWGDTSLEKIMGEITLEEFQNAHKLWLKLKEAFNEEAKAYEPEAYDSKLGSVGELQRREVLRSSWYDELNGEKYGDYGTMTLIIEVLHHGEKLETGTILFGSQEKEYEKRKVCIL